MSLTLKPPLCDCPSDDSLGRIDELVEHLNTVQILRFFFPSRRVNRMTARAERVRRRAWVRRYACRWHEPALRKIYFQPQRTENRHETHSL